MKKPKAPKLVTVAVTTTITIIFWIFFTLYQVLTTKASPSVDSKLLEPLDATLDTNALNTLNEKVYFEEGSFNFSPPASPSPVPEAEKEPAPTAVSSPEEPEEIIEEEIPTSAPASESEV